jgi:hypothetical protein
MDIEITAEKSLFHLPASERPNRANRTAFFCSSYMSYGTGHPLQGPADRAGTVPGQSLSIRWGVIYQQHFIIQTYSNDFVPRPLWRLLEEI